MRNSSVLEGIDVVLDGGNIDSAGLGSGGEELGVVDSLSSRSDFLTSHEEIVRVGVSVVILADHGVEGSGRGGVSVEHVEVSVVDLSDDGSELSLGGGVEILKGVPFDSSALEELDTLLEGDSNDGGLALEGLEGVLLTDGGELGGESGLESVEDEGEELSHEIEELEVVLVDGHFNIQSGELTHVSVSEGLLGSEDGADLEDSVEVGHDTHLLVELRRLGEASLLVEVLELEDVGSSLRSTSDELGGMDLDESVLEKELSEELADSRGDSEDGLVGGCSEIDDSVVESGLESNDGSLVTLLLLLSASGLSLSLGCVVVVTLSLGLSLLESSLSVLELEGELRSGSGDDVELKDLELLLLRAGDDFLLRLGDLGLNIDDGFLGDSRDPLDHLLGDALVGEGDALSSVALVSENDENEVSLASGVVESGSNQDGLSNEGLVDISNLGPDSVGSGLRLDELNLSVIVLEGIVLLLGLGLIGLSGSLASILLGLLSELLGSLLGETLRAGLASFSLLILLGLGWDLFGGCLVRHI